MRHVFTVKSLSAVDDDIEELACQSLNKLEKELKVLKAMKEKIMHHKLLNRDFNDTGPTCKNEMRVIDRLHMRPKGMPNKMSALSA